MKLFMLQDEVNRISALYAGVAGQNPPEAKPRERDPMKLRGGVATVKIKGPLYPKRVSWMDYWGEDYAIYSEIISDIAEAKFKGATQIDFEIDSPGGYIDGLYEAMMAIADAGIRTRTLAGGTLASAAYMLASQTDEILVESPAATVGSIGVATSMIVVDFIVDITNRDSKKKRPDVSTDEGKAVVEDELDDFWGLYAEMMASGRNTTIDNIKTNYGQGAVMTARTALSKGMIDGIMSNQPASKPAANIGAKAMTPEEIQAQFPGTYQQIRSAGVEAGKAEQKEADLCRLRAYKTYGEQSGDLKQALSDACELKAIGEDVVAHYYMAKKNRDHRNDRTDDNPPAVDTTGEAPAVGSFSKEKAELEAEMGDGFEWEEA